MSNGNESRLIQGSLKMLDKLDRKFLHVSKLPVGIDSVVNKIILLVKNAKDDAYVVAIDGMRGAGKKTVTKNSNSNIKELWNQIKHLNKMKIPSLSYSKLSLFRSRETNTQKLLEKLDLSGNRSFKSTF
ncbi:hypothetical protein NC652_020276 [Populus alba x Populus x berolinensis]|nr:hypothetical protein NC652_020276 [Populus alba x Populus x berolinensis]